MLTHSLPQPGDTDFVANQIEMMLTGSIFQDLNGADMHHTTNALDEYAFEPEVQAAIDDVADMISENGQHLVVIENLIANDPINLAAESKIKE